jgi:cystathionine beta-synthase
MSFFVPDASLRMSHNIQPDVMIFLMQIYNNVLELIGNTPLIRLNHVVPKVPHTFLTKAEFLLPGGSVKDRLALRLIEGAEKRGELKKGGTVIEATSGNTGVGLAMVAAVKGYKSIFVMPDKMSQEKIDMLRAMGAQVVLTPSGVEPNDPRSHYSVAKRLVSETPNSFYANQFHNPDNAQVHYETTGPEIWEQTGGKIDAVVHGAGTGGTISGVGRYLKEKNPKIKIILADPVGSILHDMFYFKKVKSPPSPYLVEGIGEDMVPENMHFQYVDDCVQFDDKETMNLCRDMLRLEGMYVGPSSAGILAAAIKWSKTQKEPKTILTFLCDSGNRYLSKVFNDQWMQKNNLL